MYEFENLHKAINHLIKFQASAHELRELIESRYLLFELIIYIFPIEHHV
jgi:hypothetical protein